MKIDPQIVLNQYVSTSNNPKTAAQVDRPALEYLMHNAVMGVEIDPLYIPAQFSAWRSLREMQQTLGSTMNTINSNMMWAELLQQYEDLFTVFEWDEDSEPIVRQSKKLIQEKLKGSRVKGDDPFHLNRGIEAARQPLQREYMNDIRTIKLMMRGGFDLLACMTLDLLQNSINPVLAEIQLNQIWTGLSGPHTESVIEASVPVVETVLKALSDEVLISREEAGSENINLEGKQESLRTAIMRITTRQWTTHSNVRVDAGKNIGTKGLSSETVTKGMEILEILQLMRSLPDSCTDFMLRKADIWFSEPSTMELVNPVTNPIVHGAFVDWAHTQLKMAAVIAPANGSRDIHNKLLEVEDAYKKRGKAFQALLAVM